MDPSKRQDSLNNLLQAFGIAPEIVQEGAPRAAPSSFAIVESSTKWISVAREFQQNAPTCRCIILTSDASGVTPADVRDQIKDPILLILPFTV
jgi:hypothetical protein